MIYFILGLQIALGLLGLVFFKYGSNGDGDSLFIPVVMSVLLVGGGVVGVLVTLLLRAFQIGNTWFFFGVALLPLFLLIGAGTVLLVTLDRESHDREQRGELFRQNASIVHGESPEIGISFEYVDVKLYEHDYDWGWKVYAKVMEPREIIFFRPESREPYSNFMPLINGRIARVPLADHETMDSFIKKQFGADMGSCVIKSQSNELFPNLPKETPIFKVTDTTEIPSTGESCLTTFVAKAPFFGHVDHNGTVTYNDQTSPLEINPTQHSVRSIYFIETADHDAIVIPQYEGNNPYGTVAGAEADNQYDAASLWFSTISLSDRKID